MQLPTLLLSIIGVLASVQACTTTLTTAPSCDCHAPLATSTKHVDCHGCTAIHTQTSPPLHCNIVCPTPRPIGTHIKTVAVCKPTPTAAPILPRQPEEEKAERCTSTTTVRPTCANCFKAEFTATKSVNCGRCGALATVTGRGPVCDVKCREPKRVQVGSTTTVYGCQVTPA